MKNNAFTVMEIIVVIIIIGALALLALPKFGAQQETARFSEGISAAQTLYSSQLRYQLDHNIYDTGAGCPNLDVSLSPKNFTVGCSTTTPIISLTRSGTDAPSNYIITVADTGGYDCPLCTGSLQYLRKYIPQY